MRCTRVAEQISQGVFMPTATIAIPDDLSTQLDPYRDNLDDLLRLGLRKVRMAQSLVLLQEGGISLEGCPLGRHLPT